MIANKMYCLLIYILDVIAALNYCLFECSGKRLRILRVGLDHYCHRWIVPQWLLLWDVILIIINLRQNGRSVIFWGLWQPLQFTWWRRFLLSSRSRATATIAAYTYRWPDACDNILSPQRICDLSLTVLPSTLPGTMGFYSSSLRLNWSKIHYYTLYTVDDSLWLWMLMLRIDS